MELFLRAIAILTVLVLHSCDFKSSAGYHKEANELENQEKYIEAIAVLDKAIEKDSENIEALLDRAVDKSIIEDFEGAALDYTKVIQIDPDNGLAFLNRGKNKIRIKDYNGAIVDFDSAITTKGTETFYMNKVENSFVETGFEFDVTMEEIRFERGLAYYNVDSLRCSFEDFNFLIQRNYMLPDSHYMRALIYFRYNMKDQGCKDMLKAKELGGQNAEKVIEENCK